MQIGFVSHETPAMVAPKPVVATQCSAVSLPLLSVALTSALCATRMSMRPVWLCARQRSEGAIGVNLS